MTWQIRTVVLMAAGLGAAGEELLTVHLVPHTHDDVGWLKTVDEYYAGQNNSIQNAYVHMVLDTVRRALEESPDRTFTYVEQAFFQRWWRQQPESVKEVTRTLVKSGQLEMTNGGWCMHDEAAPFYMDMIDQTTLGHKFLMEEFGVCPTTGWQLDPFGHSATQAALMSAEVGFNALYFGRIDYQDLEQRRKDRTAEFIWRASPSLGPQAQVFASLTGEYGGNYGPPAGFDWNVGSGDEPVQDDINLENYNVKSRVDDFVKLAMVQANETRGKNILWTMGSDFQYEDAFTWFENLDRIIKYVNLDGRVKAMYSTPARYTAAKAKETTVAWPLKENDFFPYADGPHQFWTGYFTSRPALKRYVRETGAVLRLTQQIVALAGGPSSDTDAKAVQRLWEAQSVAQHHDAVSGTAKQHVTFDYAKRLASGRAASVESLLNAFEKLSGSRAHTVCHLRNVSICEATQEVGRGMHSGCFVLWNALGQTRREVVELPVSSIDLRITTSDYKELETQVVSSLPSVTNYGKPAGGANYTLVFEAELPPLGYNRYCLVSRTVATAVSQGRSVEIEYDGSAPVVIENEHVALKFCNNSLCEITDKDTGFTVPAKQSWLWYKASTGNEESRQASGAYIFRPNRSEAFPVYTGVPTLRVARGSVADEVYQTFGPWVSQRVRLAKHSSHAEITYTVGAIDISDNQGKEIISRITTDLQTAGECFTDSNGRETLQRKRDYRHYWNLTQTEPVAGNYFPITTSLFIRDKHAQLTILTDASQAGSGCVKDGEIELMVHRRLLKDDGRGVGEPLNETQDVTSYAGPDPKGQHYGPGLVIRGTHLLSLSPPASAAKQWRPLVDHLHMPLYPIFGVSDTVSDKTYMKQLPANVQIVSLSQWSETQVLLRLAHQFGVGEDAELSKPTEVDLGELFVGKQVKAVDERGLAATITRAEVIKRRTPWPVEHEAPLSKMPAESAGLLVTLGPLQIRTFLVEFESMSSEKVLTAYV